MVLQHVYFFPFLRVAPRLVRGGGIAVIPCSECHCEGIIVQHRGKGGEMALSLRSKSIVASTRRRLFEHSDCSRVRLSDSEREAFMSGQSVHQIERGLFLNDFRSVRL